MFYDGPIQRLIAFIQSHNGIGNKDELKELVKNEFHLTLDRKVYYCNAFITTC